MLIKMKKTIVFIGLMAMGLSVLSQNKLTYLLVNVTKGNVSAHFSRYNGPYDYGLSHNGTRMKIPSGKQNFTKLFHRDDDNRRIYAGESWKIQNQDIGGPGIYILDIADWDNASMSIKLEINNTLLFIGNGSCADFDCWKYTFYGYKVQKIGDREIAIEL
jgi:hypothetical protein